MTINTMSPFIRIEIINDLRIVYYREDGRSLIFDKKTANLFTAQLENEDMLTVDVTDKAIMAIS